MKTKTFFLILILVLIPVLFNIEAQAQTQTVPLEFHEDWLKGVVLITYQSYYGTGFWINNQYVATAAHVVGYNPNAIVTVIKGTVRSSGRVVALDRATDVAVIYVENANAFEKHIFPIARELPRLTSTIYVIGYPYELLQVLGSVEALSEHPRVLRTSFAWSANGLIELGGITDAGNSGGPVLDFYGNVIGIVSFAARGEAGYMYYATSAGNLKQLCQEHNIAYIEGTNGIIPEEIASNPAAVAAISGAAASLVTDIAILLAGIGIGTGVLVAKRRRKR
ncbi:MAG: hypothetical protein DRO12_05180 [Thermoprotei archaeon]|nr:MAG: hypothetical protein DRO12_05180 [Thermoprotei archaeon]